MMTAAIAPVFVHASIRRRKNVWYTVKDGLWSDPTIWKSNSSSPTTANTPNLYPNQAYSTSASNLYAAEDVYISHNVTIPTNNFVAYANNLYISAAGSLTSSGNSASINVTADLQCLGLTSLSNTAQLFLYGVNNYINNWSNTGSTTVTYTGRNDQNILDLNYINLNIRGSGEKKMLNNITLPGSFNAGFSTLNQGSFNLIVNGTTVMSNASTYIANTGAFSLFVGLVTLSSVTVQFNGTPTLEFRGSLINNTNNNFQLATVNFTTNSQSISGNGTLTISGDLTIFGNITLTNLITRVGYSDGLSVYNVFGTTSTSTFSNKGSLIVYVQTMPMAALGIFLYNDDPVALIGFFANGSFALPYTSFTNASTGGDGLKTLAGNTTVTGNFGVNPGPTNAINGTAGLDCGTYNMTIGGILRLTGYHNFYKTGAGTVIVTGLILSSGGANIFLGVGATLECRGGAQGSNGMAFNGTPTVSVGGNVIFTTNNQSILSTVSSQLPITISGAITLTAIGSLGTRSTIDGNNPASKLICDIGSGSINLLVNTFPMNTNGIWDISLGTIIYGSQSNQNIKGGTYNALTLSGAGLKSLQGNVTVPALNYQIIGTSAALNLNGYTLTLT